MKTSHRPVLCRLAMLLWLLSMLPVTSFAQDDASAEQMPNVLLILSDDQGWSDYGFMGHPTIQTPNLDALARRSLVWERGYVVSPLCRPSLASLVTGLYPHQHGVYANDITPATGQARAEENRPLIEQFHQHPSLIRTLVEHGYLAFQSGKWWEGSWRDGGFTHGMTHGDALRGGRHGDVGLAIGRDGMQPILQFIDDAVASQRPFFVWYAPFLPHTPHTPPAALLEKYQAAGRPDNVAKYFAMCDWFDQTCGHLLDHLAERNVSENTLVVYLSDNGWAPVDAQADNPEGWWNDYAPRSKGSPFEMGIRTPIMLSWPRRIAAGRASELASSLDIMPTILTACRIPPPTGLPGIDLLNETTRRDRTAVFGASFSIHNMTPGDPWDTLQYRWCIEGDWKLLLRHHGRDTTQYRTVHQWDDTARRLYHLGRDPLEQTNVIDAHSDIVQRLTRRIEQQIPADQ